MAAETTNVSTEEARQGETGRHVRYVLGWSLLLAALALGAVALFVISGDNPTA